MGVSANILPADGQSDRTQYWLSRMGLRSKPEERVGETIQVNPNGIAIAPI